MFQIFHNIDVAEFFGIVLKKFGKISLFTFNNFLKG